MTKANENIEFSLLMLRSTLQVFRLVAYLFKSYETLKIHSSIEMINVHEGDSEKGMESEDTMDATNATSLSSGAKRRDSEDEEYLEGSPSKHIQDRSILI